MDRRKLLLVVAAVLAALGMLLVFLYAKSADSRAAARYDAVEVLTAAQQIEPGETVEEAAAAGKFTLTQVPRAAVLPGALTSTETIVGKVASSRIYPGEQLVAAKFGTEASSSVLQIPKGKVAASVQLTDTARVAGFVTPGSEVAIFVNGINLDTQLPFTRMLLERVTVLGVGSTTPVSTTTTDESGAQTTEELPRTLLTLALSQEEAQRVMYAGHNHELAFALLTPDSSIKQADAVTNTNLFR